ncbi:hypothetical protein CYY_000178 [Polysphondylium violaceum]|uniref:Protein DD3-3 n=1 Tax=Polysphondylium violaceum TaxID=133409 RepID=A0A8J4V2N9_9MYCE|nr:hypothetical protein CYY_000178 [Polysphondylium violaceum]
MKVLSFLVLIALVMSAVRADIYMHCPPGSNNRNQEEGQNAQQQNRLFNSQNNARGGYCRGGAMEWYEKSILPIQWTQQHACGSDQTDCNVVLQYMCTDINTAADYESMRDGTTTNRIENTLEATSARSTNEFQYGLHEDYYHYSNCSKRFRNKGLFTATQNPGDAATKTRQQPNSDRYGFECPEERDYYPYWAPSPWKDIAIFTDNKDLCKMYKKESQNVKEKYYCALPSTANTLAPIIETDCTQAGGVWTKVPSHGIDAPECLKAEWNAVNHLGNSLNSGAPNTYNWSLPHSGMEPCIATGSCACVVRVRYNISSSDIDGWGFMDSTFNGRNSPITNDPTVQVAGANLTLELNTAQIGRTFQDRSHIFRIKSRPKDLKNAKIWNLTVKGKRGNIQQAYPAVEYQFVPSQLHIKINEYIHWQWTGCDFNPQGNAGGGKDQTDRHNAVQIKSLNHNIPMTDDEVTKDNRLFESDETRLFMAYLNQKGCKNATQLLEDHPNSADDREQDSQNCMRLNAAPTQFDGGVYKMKKTGSFYYMSTRNNNFSNRNQKGAIHVDPILKKWEIGLIAAGGTLFVGMAATAGSLFFARTHPHSGANRFFAKVPVLNKAL